MQPSAEEGGESLAQAEANVEVVAVEEVPTSAPTPAPVEEPYPLADPGEYYIGLWSGMPNYGCPYCGYATLEGPGAVELHILEKIDQGNIRHQKALELQDEGGPA